MPASARLSVYRTLPYCNPQSEQLTTPTRLMGRRACRALLQRVEHEVGVRSLRHAPADDTAGVGVDDVHANGRHLSRGNVDEARPEQN
jgi:hypothetical protein